MTPSDYITEAKLPLKYNKLHQEIQYNDSSPIFSIYFSKDFTTDQEVRTNYGMFIAAAINEKIQREKAGISSFMPMPDGIKIFNSGHEPCDTLIGPCCCGGWHDIEWFLKKHEEYVRELYLSTLTKK